MQIIIPMSGYGERFRTAGYSVPKPLIEIEGKPIIAHVLDMFPGEQQVLFICNQEHLAHPQWNMEKTLRSLCPTGTILGIASHKLGPVHAVLQAREYIRLDMPAVVNYCDFTCYWDWHHFRNFIHESDCDGAIPAYRGFHPHNLGTTNYAYMQEHDGWVKDIQEKQPFTANRMQEYASSGTYYFRRGDMMLLAMQQCQDQNLHVNNEYYVSLAYKPLLQAQQAIAVYELQHFMQWGTPEDVKEYLYWSRAFRRLGEKTIPSAREETQGSIVLPMAGMGQRFADAGYTTTKPLIEVSGLSMVIQATRDLPPAKSHAFVLREDMPGVTSIIAQLKQSFPGCITTTVEKVTEGQACTALLGLDALSTAAVAEEPITFGACDNGVLYDAARYHALLDDPTVDVIVWAIRGYPNAMRYPHMYGWIDADGTHIKSISVKVPLGNPAQDPIVLGMFTFKKAADIRQSIARMIERNARVNNEFYLDTCINDALALGLRCHILEVESYLCWGTPNDLRTFEYWQSCFHKWPQHPYRLEHDGRIPTQARASLEQRYAPIVPPLPILSSSRKRA